MSNEHEAVRPAASNNNDNISTNGLLTKQQSDPSNAADFTHETNTTFSALPTYASFPQEDLRNHTQYYSDEKHSNGPVLDASANAGGNGTLADMDAANANTNVPAGRLPEEVYTNTLSPWRAAMRRQLVEIVEWESGVLAKVQVRVIYGLIQSRSCALLGSSFHLALGLSHLTMTCKTICLALSIVCFAGIVPYPSGK